MKQLWHSLLLLVLVLTTVSAKANANTVATRSNTAEVCLLQSTSSKATLPDVLQVANHLPVAFRSSNFMVSSGEYAGLNTVPALRRVSSTISCLNCCTPSLPIHISNRVLLI